MKLEYQGKSLEYNLDGSLRGTVVILGNMDLANYPVLLAEDQTALSNQELFDKAMEAIYQENFPQRAENEKFAEVTKKLEQLQDEVEAVERLGKHKESYLNQLVQTSQNVMTAQGTLRSIKKNGNRFTDEQVVEVLNTLAVGTFQAVDLLRNVIAILK